MWAELNIPFAFYVACCVVLVHPNHGPSLEKIAQTDARTIHPIVDRYRVDHPDCPCPTLETLRDENETSRGSKLSDPWDHPYVIECRGDGIRVSSAGPDRRFGTKDDIIISSPP